MKLKTTKKPVAKSMGNTSLPDNAKRIAEITAEINEKCKQAADLKMEIEELAKKRLELSIYPHKLGDKVVAEVQSGKTRKKTECVLEAGENGALYVRPFKNDGELSGRRFSICPVGGQSYSDFIE